MNEASRTQSLGQREKNCERIFWQASCSSPWNLAHLKNSLYLA